MELYKNEDLCIECKNEFYSKPYDHRDPTPGQLGYCIKCDNCLIKDKKMEFNKSRCYSALNADELKAGDKVIVADTMANLRVNVEKGTCAYVLKKVQGEECLSRFLVSEGWYPLAYIVEREENCLNCSTSCMAKSWLANKYTRCDSYKPFPLKPSKICINCEYYSTGYCNKHDKPTRYDNICPDYLLNKPKTGQMCLNCKHYNKVNDFRDCTLVDNPTGACPHYEAEPHYRPFKDTDELIKVWCDKGGKWQKRELTMPLIWVRRKESNCKGQLITKFSDPLWVIMSTEGYNMTDLFEHFTFLDGSVCGVEE